jgi:hypothetical protein
MQDARSLPSPPPSTVARLFKVQENVIMLGGSVLFSAALASPIPLLAAAAGELVWLGVGSTSPAVRRWLDERDARADGERKETAVPVATPHEKLEPEYARRVLTLDRALATIRSFGGARPTPVFVQGVERLETLRPVYFGLCETHQRIGRFLAGTSEAQLAGETERLKAQFAAEKDLGLRLTLRQAAGSAQRRVEHRQHMEQLQKSIGVKLESAERSLAYLVSQGLTLAASPRLLDDVEALVAEVGPAIAVEVEQGPASLPPSA